MKQNRSAPHLSLVIAAARRRRLRVGEGGGGYGKIKNNYIAENPLSVGSNSGNRKGAGAPPGNFNASALKPRTPEFRDFLERRRALYKRMKIIVAHAKAARRDGDHPDKRLAALHAQLRRCDEGHV